MALRYIFFFINTYDCLSDVSQVHAILLNRSIYDEGKTHSPYVIRGGLRDLAEDGEGWTGRTVAGHGWVVNMQM